MKLQRVAVRARGSHTTACDTCLSVYLWVLQSPGWPSHSHCSCNSLSKQGGPWLGRNGRQGSPWGERCVCVCVCVFVKRTSWIRYTSFNSLRYLHTPLPCLFVYKEAVMPSSPQGQYLTFRAKSGDIHQRVKSSKFSHGGGRSLIKHVLRKAAAERNGKLLHPVIYAEPFEVEPEGRDQTGWFQASQRARGRDRGRGKRTQTGTHSCSRANFPPAINDLVILLFCHHKREINNTANKARSVFRSLTQFEIDYNTSQDESDYSSVRLSANMKHYFRNMATNIRNQVTRRI